MTPYVGSAGLGLVLAAPDGPAQAVGDGGLVAVNEVEEPADFGEGEIDEMSVDGWCGFEVGPGGGVVVVGGESFGVLAPLFLVVCAVIAKKVWASMDRVMCRCQASQVRTW